jgi:enterochelin esterase family protein
MGGGQAVRIGLGHPDLFGSIGCLSGGAGAAQAEGAAPVLSKMQLVWVGCGRQDAGYARARDAHLALEKAGVTHVWFETDGGHEWQVWRKSLQDLASRLFRKK